MALAHILFHNLCEKRQNLSKDKEKPRRKLLKRGFGEQETVEKLALHKISAGKVFLCKSITLMLLKALANNFVHKKCEEPQEDVLFAQPKMLPHF